MLLLSGTLFTDEILLLRLCFRKPIKHARKRKITQGKYTVKVDVVGVYAYTALMGYDQVLLSCLSPWEAKVSGLFGFKLLLHSTDCIICNVTIYLLYGIIHFRDIDEPGLSYILIC